MMSSRSATRTANRLSDAARRQYADSGYVCLDALLPRDLVLRAQEAMADLVNPGRHLRASAGDYVLESSHTDNRPRLRRVYRAADLHPTFREVAFSSVLGDVAAELIGPSAKFREAYINFKWARGGDAVKWHQDAPFFPHTNMSLMTTLTYLEDCEADQGPLMIVPGSHKGELFDHYDDQGRWVACIAERDLARAKVQDAHTLTGPAGTVIFMDSRAIHGSARNDSDRGRPLLINGYAATDAFAYTKQDPQISSRYEGEIVRGEPSRYARHDPMRVKVPPDWSGGYKSIFEDQQGGRRAERTLY